jgi:hypothetical protein
LTSPFAILSRSNIMRALRRLAIAIGVLLAGLLALAAPTFAASVPPSVVAGNPTCVGLGYAFGYKPQPEPPPSGTYTFPGTTQTVTITSDGTYFSWSSTISIDAVIVKGSNAANVYAYSPEAFSDAGLNPPVNASGNLAAISHIEFCYDFEVRVTKTATTTFTRTYQWTIEKSVTPETLHMFRGDSGTVQYTVAVAKTGFTDSNWAVSGGISIYNPAPFSATITGVTDDVSGVAAPVNCSVTFPYVLTAGGTLNCTYSTALTDGSARTNTATATTSGAVGSGSGTASVTFGAPTTEVNATINVSDTNGGSWQFSDSGSVTYTRTFTCDAAEGVHDNIATILETGQSDDASVTVNCYSLNVSKTASTTFTRTYTWTIDKSVTPDTLNMFQGDSGTVQYTVVVTKTGFIDSNWVVSGSISVGNPAPIPATLNSVDDVVSPGSSAPVTCGVTFPYVLAAGATLNCTYETPLPDGTNQLNTATATLQNTPSGTTGFMYTAAVTFGAPTTEVNATINVDDTNGSSWLFAGTGSVGYTRTFTCDLDEGEHTNTATIRETRQSDSATMTLNCYALSVSKTATPSLTRTYTWTIDKSTDQTSPVTLSSGQVFDVDYSVLVSASSSDSAWAVSGNISVHNPAPIDATLTSVNDIVSSGINASVDCSVGFPYTLAAGATLNCTYSTALPDASTRTNTVTATLQNTPSGTTSFNGTASVNFSQAQITEVDECITLDDDLYGSLGTVCASQAPKTIKYTDAIGPYTTCGLYEVVNTASFVTSDTGTTGSDSVTVNVDVPCDGCTLTQGYWKTHSDRGPAPYDDGWMAVGPLQEDTPFFNSNRTWYTVFWTPPAGNAYFNLAHQYMAAKLNLLNGAASTSAVDAAITGAEALFNAQGPGDVMLSATERRAALGFASTLDQYNNGLIGPGHCDEQQ